MWMQKVEETRSGLWTSVHGRAALDFVSSSGCGVQMVAEPTHIDEGVPDLVLKDVHDLVKVRGGPLIET